MLKKIFSNPFLLFPLITCIFFWPISLHILTFKNDALTYYYPVRTLISDALNNFELPLWTPFINMGYPLHADMQSGAWNPVIWIFALLTNYSLAAFHFEMIFYIALGGIGFYYLGREYGWNKTTAFLFGFAYSFSGPLIDSMQFIACISSASYIPFVFLFFRRLLNLKQPTFNAILTALFLNLLFTGGYPALFIITSYLLVCFFFYHVFSAIHKIEFVKKLILPLVLVGGLFFLLSLPAIISFVNHLQFIDRGNKLGLAFVLENSMPPSCMLSLISPFSTTAAASFFNTNILMRNIYIGIVPLVFLIYGVSNKVVRKNKELRFFLITAFILFALAWGSHFFLRQVAYYTLPLMNTFRHPALFRFFGVMFFLLAAGFSMNEWSKENSNNYLIKKIIVSVGAIAFFIGILSILLPGSHLIPAAINISGLKKIISTLSFQQRFLVQLPFITTSLCIFYVVISKKYWQFYLLLLSIGDLFFATQLNIPVTVAGARKFSDTEILINRNPVSFPLPGIETIEQNLSYSIDTTNTIGSVLPFEKQIGRNDYFITPGNLSLNERFYESPIRVPVFKNRLLYFADSLLENNNKFNIKDLGSASFAIITVKGNYIIGKDDWKDTIIISKLSANSLECRVENSNPRLMILLQNIYPGWKVLIDGKEAPILTANITFMGVYIPAGKHEIIFNYHPSRVIYAWYISIFTLFGMCLLLLRFFLMNKRLSNKNN